MSYHPYPNADRALRQLARHHIQRPAPPPAFPMIRLLGVAAEQYLAAGNEALRPFREMMETLRAQANRPHALYDPKSGQFGLVADHSA
ncbi:hypothetical protein ABTX80_22450 [Streptomyces erythrochromogenes]|uniref:hypothetical protein n=1 Tax=Streptomyces erythrochromogenes TaxID=285574 RepID=UPI0033316B7E